MVCTESHTIDIETNCLGHKFNLWKKNERNNCLGHKFWQRCTYLRSALFWKNDSTLVHSFKTSINIATNLWLRHDTLTNCFYWNLSNFTRLQSTLIDFVISIILLNNDRNFVALFLFFYFLISRIIYYMKFLCAFSLVCFDSFLGLHSQFDYFLLIKKKKKLYFFEEPD